MDVPLEGLRNERIFEQHKIVLSSVLSAIHQTYCPQAAKNICKVLLSTIRQNAAKHSGKKF